MDLCIENAELKRRIALFIGGAKNVYPCSTDTIPPVRKFSSFFANSENKIRLQALLLDEFKNFGEKYQKNI